MMLRIEEFEIYKLGFGSRTWCVRQDGVRGAVCFGSRDACIAWVEERIRARGGRAA